MGVKSKPFVLVYNRDSGYLKKTFKFDLSYHDFRNSSIENYLLAVKELTKKGYFVIRVGKNVQTKLHSNNNKINKTDIINKLNHTLRARSVPRLWYSSRVLRAPALTSHTPPHPPMKIIVF